MLMMVIYIIYLRHMLIICYPYSTDSVFSNIWDMSWLDDVLVKNVVLFYVCVYGSHVLRNTRN